MELSSLQCRPVACPSCSTTRKPIFFSARPLRLLFSSKSRRCTQVRAPGFFDLKPPKPGNVQAASVSNVEATGVASQDLNSDNNIVFVAGATGKVGSRAIRELLKLGFQVRAGVRSAQRAESLVQSVRQMKLDDVTTSASEIQPVERLEVVECDLEKKQDIGSAIGNASTVICCIGASEKEILDVTGPYRIDYIATKNLIDAAISLKVDHFILVTSLGTNKIGFPAAILNLFWGVLAWKRKAEEALLASGLSYTIVRPGGMERPTDAYKETHNIVLANEDTYFGGQVSNLQVAELIAVMAKNRNLSCCKVVEVIAETTAPLTPMENLLSKIPSQRVFPPKQSQPTSTANPTPVSSMPSEPMRNPDPTPVITSPEPTISLVDNGPIVEPQKSRPLSPYTAYADLKPPTSPTPTPSTTRIAMQGNSNMDSSPANIEKEPIETVMPKLQPLSPYTVYDDLKPPSSPSPCAPTTKSSSYSLEGSASLNTLSASHPLSPYTMYKDFKPPSSPMPSMPRY